MRRAIRLVKLAQNQHLKQAGIGFLNATTAMCGKGQGQIHATTSHQRNNRHAGRIPNKEKPGQMKHK
jgi:hypothetical protein